MWKRLFRESGKQWRDTFRWLGYTLLTGFMPIWIAWLWLSDKSDRPVLETFASNGEFAIYSASLLSGSLYLITRNSGSSLWNDLGNLILKRRVLRTVTFPGQSFFVLFFFALSLGAAVLYTINLASHLQNPAESFTGDWLIRNLTISLFAVSFFLSFLIVFIDNYWAPATSEASGQDEYIDLRTKFRRTK